jgi:ribosome maturation factor RimP
MNGSLIQEMVGKKVQVYSVHGAGEHQVVGTLEAFDGTWIKVRKADSEILFFSVYQIRLVKNFL